MNGFPNMLPPPPAPQFPPQVPQVPKQPSTVDNALSNLGGNLVALERALENLVKRIAPALTPLTPQAPTAGSPQAPTAGSPQAPTAGSPQAPTAGSPKAARPASSGLTQAIEDKVDRAAMLVETIDGITNRVEL